MICSQAHMYSMTIHFAVSKKEHAAIREYARMCGETVSSLIRKIIIQEITFLKNTPRDIPVEYAYGMTVPDGVSNEEKIIEANYNKIRTIIGLKKIRFS